MNRLCLALIFVFAASASADPSRMALLASARGMASYKPAIRPLLFDVVTTVGPRTSGSGGGLASGGTVGGDLYLSDLVDLKLASSGTIQWSASTDPNGVKDLGFYRVSAGTVLVSNGGTGFGTLAAGKVTTTSLGTPATPVITQGGAGGATAYSYKIVAKLPDTTTTQAGTAGSTATGNAVLDVTNYNIITWAATTNAYCYDVYRTVGGATQGKIATCVASPLNDTGLAGDASTAPGVNSTGMVNGVWLSTSGTTVCIEPYPGSCGAFTDGVELGYAAVVSGNRGTAVGRSASAASAGSAVGYSSTATAATFVSGASGYPMTNVYFGEGITDATPAAWTLNGTGGTGSNIVGGNLQLAGGISTGDAAPSRIVFRTTTPGGSGSVAQTLWDAGSLGYGAVGMLRLDNGTTTNPVASFVDNSAAIPTTGPTATTNILDGALLQAGNSVLTTGTMTAENQGLVTSVVHSYVWTNAMVVALGAATSGEVTVATLPAKTVVKNAYVVITGAAVGPTTVTASLGRTAADYIDYIVASNAKAAANTVYGDASAERGTNLVGYDLPSYTATTAVKVQFVSTGANLDTVTGSTGRVILETALVP